jgi:hypothetical protein
MSLRLTSALPAKEKGNGVRPHEEVPDHRELSSKNNANLIGRPAGPSDSCSSSPEVLSKLCLSLISPCVSFKVLGDISKQLRCSRPPCTHILGESPVFFGAGAFSLGRDGVDTTTAVHLHTKTCFDILALDSLGYVPNRLRGPLSVLSFGSTRSRGLR